MNLPNVVPANPPALRLVSTKAMSREDWLDVRRRGIGASEAAAACGISPYQSPLELWLIKTGRDKDLSQPDPEDVTAPVYWGNLLEPSVAKAYSQFTGYKVRRVHAVLQHPDPDKAFMLANLDYAVVANTEVQILECKTAGPWGSQRWAEGVPEDIQCQVQHQLAVTGKQAADVCVLLGGQQLKVFRVLRDELLIARLVKLERQFWRFVETDIPPPVDGSASCAEALSCLFPKDNGTAVDFSEDRSLCRTFQALRGVRDEMKPLQTAEAKLRQTLQQAMGEHSEAVFPEGRISWKRSQDSTRIDSKRLQAEEPLLAERFQVSVPGSRRFVLKD